MEEKQSGQVGVLRVYLKDSSFESPSAPQVFSRELNPEIKVNLSIEKERVADDVFEVTLTVTAEAKKGDETTFIVEVEQAGLFQVQGLQGDELEFLLEVFCPTTLFPYARHAIDASLSLGSFPPLMLAPVNFEVLFQQKRERQATQAPLSH